MSEHWKDVPGFPGYKASSKGRFFSIKYQRILNGNAEYAKKHRTYIKIYMKKWRYAHVMIAKTFIPNPENKQTVNHIDGDIYNNSIDNLEWATREEQTKHAVSLCKTAKRGTPIIKITKTGEIIRYESLEDAIETEETTKQNIWRYIGGRRPGPFESKWYFEKDYLLLGQEEEWKDVIIEGKNTSYKVSTLGRVKNPRGRVLRGAMQQGYVRISFTKNKKNYASRMAHGLVINAFIGPCPEGMTVDHINRIRHDNRLCNLRYATSKEQRANSSIPSEPGKATKKAIWQIDLNGKCVARHASASVAAEYIGKTAPSNIANVCRGEQEFAYGYKWRYAEPVQC